MKITEINKPNDNELRVFFEDASYEYLNELRRIIKTEVPVLSIEDVDIHMNSSGLYDEMIAHRLGLLVLKTDLETYNLKEECSCGGVGCASCQVQFSVKGKGPKVVHAKDINFKDPAIKPIHGDTPIIKILEGQEIQIEGTAELGKGKEHMKWSPAHVHYYNLIKLNSVDKISDQDKKDAVNKFLSDNIDLKGNKIKEDIVKNYKGTEFAEDIEEIDSEVIEDSFCFIIESWGALDPEKLFLEAAGIIDTKLENLESWLKTK
ncbi:MAG: DNA-directed RNA polymerase subunit D [Candidatus Woesearchaeota archaeon]